METLGLPIDILWGSFIVLIGFVAHSVTKLILDKQNKLELQIKEGQKQLSKDEFKELEGVIKQEVTRVLDSKQFREDLKYVVRDVLIHCNKTNEIQMKQLYDTVIEVKELLTIKK